MNPVVSFVVTLVILGLAESVIHLLSLWLELPDIVALLLMALPLVLFISYCSHESRAQIIRAAIRIYAGFAAVVIASAAIVYFIG